MVVPFGAILVMAFLVYREPDFGTACIVFGVPLLMAIALLVRPFYWGGLGLLGGIIALGIGALQPYRMKRILVWIDPWSDARDAGYQMVQSLSTIGSGGIFGMGFGDGVSKYEYLPEAHTDFAFAIFSQEHGFLGVLLIFFFIGVLLIYCLRVAARAKDVFGQVLALGIVFLVLGQALANLAMVAGLLPVVGVPLPFISYGGSTRCDDGGDGDAARHCRSKRPCVGRRCAAEARRRGGSGRTPPPYACGAIKGLPYAGARAAVFQYHCIFVRKFDVQ